MRSIRQNAPISSEEPFPQHEVKAVPIRSGPHKPEVKPEARPILKSRFNPESKSMPKRKSMMEMSSMSKLELKYIDAVF